MLWKYIQDIVKICNEAERQNWSVFDAVNYIRMNVQKIANQELDELEAQEYTRRMDDDCPEPWTDNPRAS